MLLIRLVTRRPRFISGVRRSVRAPQAGYGRVSDVTLLRFRFYVYVLPFPFYVTLRYTLFSLFRNQLRR